MPGFTNQYRPQYNPLAISPGDLRHSIQLAARSTAQDGFGQPLTTWTPYLTVRASIRQLSGQELFQGDQFSSAAQYRIVLRWPGSAITINVGDRVLFGSHVYVIQIVDNVLLRNRVINLTCLEIDGTN